MKKYSIMPSRVHVIGLALLLIGLIFTISGILRREAMAHAVDIDELSLGSLKRGEYVTGTVTELLSSEHNGVFYPVAGTNAATDTTYYLIPIGDGHEYVTLTVPKSLLEYFKPGYFSGDGSIPEYSLFGRVTGLEFGLNYEGIEMALGLDDSSQSGLFVSEAYSIKIADPKSERAVFYAGLALLFAGGALIFSGWKDLHIRRR